MGTLYVNIAANTRFKVLHTLNCTSSRESVAQDSGLTQERRLEASQGTGGRPAGPRHLGITLTCTTLGRQLSRVYGHRITGMTESDEDCSTLTLSYTLACSMPS